MSEKYAFRCNTCQRLETSDQAGENDTPAACPSCGAGVSFDPKSGAKQLHPENWTVLADLSPEELEAQRVVTKSDGATYEYWDKGMKIQKHKPWPKSEATREPQNIERSAAETVSAEDKTS